MNLPNQVLLEGTGETKPVAASSGLKSLDRKFRFLVEATASMIVVIEAAVLGAGVVSRYVFRKPITWTDELATTLFLWLAMFVSLIALDPACGIRLATG